MGPSLAQLMLSLDETRKNPLGPLNHSISLHTWEPSSKHGRLRRCCQLYQAFLVTANQSASTKRLQSIQGGRDSELQRAYVRACACV